MRVGFFGGSFDPPHVGHAMVAAWLIWTDQVDEVWLVPVSQHAFGKRSTEFPVRLRWCEALAESLGPRVRVSDIEGEMAGPSYTFRTLCELQSRFSEHSFRPILGSDLVSTLSKWHRGDELQARFPPIFVNRAGYPKAVDGPVFPEISSSEVRARLVEGGDCTQWLDAAVWARVDIAHIQFWEANHDR